MNFVFLLIILPWTILVFGQDLDGDWKAHFSNELKLLSSRLDGKEAEVRILSTRLDVKDSEGGILSDRLQSKEIDDHYFRGSMEMSRSAPGSDRVCMEPLPAIQHVTKIQVPPLPPKSPTRREFLAPQETTSNPPPIKLLPPYPSSVAAKKSRRKSLNIDKVDGKLKRRHSIKN